ncbi:MAG: hypothetical protein HYY01_00975 [Chloroflexi bacterium]|nr:hypothetical protein [Chloroflexota bacterium]
MKSLFGRRRHNPRVLVALLLVVVSMVAVAAAAGSGGPGHGWGWGHGNWGHGNWGWWGPSWPTTEWSWDNDTSNVNINVEAGNFLDIDVPSYYPTGSPCGGCGGGSWAWPGLLINSNQLLNVDIDVDVSQ